MGYRVDPNAKNVWVRDIDDTEDLPLAVNASSVYFNSGKTMEQEFGKGAMSSNIATVDSGMEKVIDGTYDGAYESCKMYGKSLVNILTGEVESNLSQKYIDFPIVGVKANTTYMAIFNLETNAEFPKCGILLNKNTWNATSKPCNNKYNKILLTTTSDETVGLRIRYDDGATDRILEPTNVMLIEYQEGMENWDIPYFEGICDVKMPILKNIGKNLINFKEKSQGWSGAYILNKGGNKITFMPNTNGDAAMDATFELKNNVLFKAGTTFTYSARRVEGGNSDFQGQINNRLLLSYEDGTEETIHSPDFKSSNFDKTLTITFTLSKNCTNIKTKPIMYTIHNLKSPIVLEYQLEESELATPIEPYKTSILTTPEQVVLRKVSDVCDSYDALTGEYVQRIGEVTLDGSDSENWSLNSVNEHNIANFLLRMTFANDVQLITDRFKKQTSTIANTTDEGFLVVNGTGVYFRILASKANDVASFKQWLSQNPVTVQYELETPIMTTIEPSTIPFVYENGHIILESGHEGQSLLPTLEYQTVVSRSGQVTMIDKTIQQHERKITLLEKMLVQNIIDIEYKNTLLALKLEIDEVI